MKKYLLKTQFETIELKNRESACNGVSCQKIGNNLFIEYAGNFSKSETLSFDTLAEAKTAFKAVKLDDVVVIHQYETEENTEDFRLQTEFNYCCSICRNYDEFEPEDFDNDGYDEDDFDLTKMSDVKIKEIK